VDGAVGIVDRALKSLQIKFLLKDFIGNGGPPGDDGGIGIESDSLISKRFSATMDGIFERGSIFL
jgi:hypothetical protein